MAGLKRSGVLLVGTGVLADRGGGAPVPMRPAISIAAMSVPPGAGGGGSVGGGVE